MNKKDQALPYVLEVSIHKEYLHARVTGEDTQAVSLSFLNELLDICEEKNIRRILIEENLDGNMSVTELYELTVSLSDRVLNNHIKIAFYDHNEEHLDLNQFGETVALNQGWNVRICQSLEEARGWLLTKNDRPAPHLVRPENML